jgi:uncharacterized protein with FMN-binding domain
MRRSTAIVLGTLTGAVLMTAAKLGTPPSLNAETFAEAPFEGGSADPALSATPTAGAADATPTGAPPPPPNRATTSATQPQSAPTTTAAAPPNTALRSGTFTGPAVTHKYGTLQITIVVNGGAITDVRWVYKTSLRLSENINADALPRLRRETLDIQSAQVHTVSGATYTSGAYRTSLQAAIDRAT